MIHAPTFPSTDELVKEINRLLLSLNKECKFAICDSMDGLGGYYAK